MFFKASDAFKTWKKTTSKERASILRKIGDLVLENKVGNYLDRERKLRHGHDGDDGDDDGEDGDEDGINQNHACYNFGIRVL